MKRLLSILAHWILLILFWVLSEKYENHPSILRRIKSEKKDNNLSFSFSFNKYKAIKEIRKSDKKNLIRKVIYQWKYQRKQILSLISFLTTSVIYLSVQAQNYKKQRKYESNFHKRAELMLKIIGQYECFLTCHKSMMYLWSNVRIPKSNSWKKIDVVFVKVIVCSTAILLW